MEREKERGGGEQENSLKITLFENDGGKRKLQQSIDMKGWPFELVSKHFGLFILHCKMV